MSLACPSRFVGEALDPRNVRALREALGEDAELMADAKQAFDLEGALRVSKLLALFGLRWLEEPLRVDRPAAEWKRLAAASRTALAAAGGDGTLEFDCHPNAARELVVGSLLPVRNGRVPVPDGPGLGAAPDLRALSCFRTGPA